MPKYLVNILIAFIIFLLAASMLSKSDEEAAGNISSQISQIEQGASGPVIEDGQDNVPNLNYYRSNWLSKTLFAIGDIIAGAIRYVFEIFTKVVKTVID